MNIKVWYLPYFEDVCHTLMIEAFANANENTRMIRMVHSMLHLTNDLTVEPEPGLPVFGRRFSDDDDGNADRDALSRLPSRVAR